MSRFWKVEAETNSAIETLHQLNFHYLALRRNMKAENLNFTVSDERFRPFLASQHFISYYLSTFFRRSDFLDRKWFQWNEIFLIADCWRELRDIRFMLETGQRDFWRILIRFVKIFWSVIATSNQLEIQIPEKERTRTLFKVVSGLVEFRGDLLRWNRKKSSLMFWWSSLYSYQPF